MLEVENYRRNFASSVMGHPGNLSDRLLPPPTGGSYLPFHGHITKPQAISPPQWPVTLRTTGQPTASDEHMSKSDEEDEDDEYRPFTPPPPRERLSYTRYQLQLLNGIYNHVRYPNSTQKQLIAKRVGITREQVKIWFQNRRRKDVVNKDKPKDKDDVDNGVDNKSDNGDSDSGVSDTGSAEVDDDPNKSMVPTVVLKSVIAELNKFDKDFKPKKTTKKKSKAAKQKSLREKYTSALLQGGFDVINPPNQIVPSAALGRKSLNHSSQSSAFQTPRDNTKNSASIASFLETLGAITHSKMTNRSFLNNPSELPVLSDLLRPNCDHRNKTECTSSNPSAVPPQYPSPISRDTVPSQTSPSAYHNPLGYFYPYPFIAEPALMLSSVRHPEAYRTYGHGLSCVSEPNVPFQTLCVSQLGNPYFAGIQPVTPMRWSGHNHSSASSTSDSSYEQL